jgi:hypothetical protein
VAVKIVEIGVTVAEDHAPRAAMADSAVPVALAARAEIARLASDVDPVVLVRKVAAENLLARAAILTGANNVNAVKLRRHCRR